MQKIPTLFKRDPENRRYVTDEVNPECEWVLSGEGVATRKYDGTCVMFDGEKWWARREVKLGKPEPKGFVPVSLDPITDKTVGWEPIEQSSFYKFFQEALANILGGERFLKPGTFELCGPKINRNPEDYFMHELIPHADATKNAALSGKVLRVLHDVGLPTVVQHIKIMVGGVLGEEGPKGWEGVVWHHPDGRMAKLKARDIKKL